MGFFKNINKKPRQSGLSPKEAANALFTVVHKTYEGSLDNISELTPVNDAQAEAVISELVKARAALLLLAVNTYDQSIAQAYFDGLVREIHNIFKRAEFSTASNFTSWEKDLLNSYLLEENSTEFLSWANRIQGTLKLKPYSQESNKVGKPLYQLTYRLLIACGVSPQDSASILVLPAVFVEAYGTIAGTNQGLSKDMNFIVD